MASCSSSILVNLETHKIVDLLADREAESVQKWLAAHPEVDVVSRDRGGCYIDGATWGAPQATQVADRWHLLSNLGDAVEAFLIRAHIRLEDEGAVPEKKPVPDHPLSSFSATPARPSQVAGTSLTQMEAVSARAGVARSWDEPAQDRGRTGVSS